MPASFLTLAPPGKGPLFFGDIQHNLASGIGDRLPAEASLICAD